MRAEMELGEAQKTSPEALKSLEINLKMKKLDVHETIETYWKPLIFLAPKASCELRFASKRLSS